MEHTSVLLKESIDALAIRPDGIYVDGTLGRGGHSSEVLKQLESGHLYAFDRDEAAIGVSDKRLSVISDHYTIIRSNFASLKSELAARGIEHIDGLLLDLGVSSPQFDDASRGFSYRFDAPLDMRMDQRQPLSAYEVVNEWDYHELVSILFRYGEEKFAKQIARRIEQVREKQPIRTTFELLDVIKSALPMKVLNAKGHPAKKTFQAIRIAVNDELQELHIVLQDALVMLNPQGRIAVITFQSLEDRIVKDTFREYSSVQKIDKRIPLLPEQLETPPYRLISRKPILPGNEELMENNRAHSAKLRVIERIR